MLYWCGQVITGLDRMWTGRTTGSTAGWNVIWETEWQQASALSGMVAVWCVLRKRLSLAASLQRTDSAASLTRVPSKTGSTAEVGFAIS